MHVTVFGSGYVGLVQAAVLAEIGHHVLCVDIDKNRVKLLQKGKIPIYESGLDVLVHQNQKSGRLQFSDNLNDGVNFSDILFIAVGTPENEDGSVDLRAVFSVATAIGSFMNDYKIVVNKSTVPVGTADDVSKCIENVLTQRNQRIDFDVISNPEFLKEGTAVADCMNPDRIVLGSDNESVINTMRTLYAPFNKDQERIIVMDTKSAELTKYAANCLLATKISFMNELANIAEKVGADIESVRQGIGCDPRIGMHFLNAGCGYGGACLPKDVNALIHITKSIGYDARLLNAVEWVNRQQKHKLFNMVSSYFNSHLKGKVFAIWGLAFKPNTNDIRNATSLVLIEELLTCGATVQVFDPVAMNETRKLYINQSNVIFCDNKDATLNNADALIVCTEWSQFSEPDFELIKEQLNNAVIFDGRNLYDPTTLNDKGIAYFCIGRGTPLFSAISLLGQYEYENSYIN